MHTYRLEESVEEDKVSMLEDRERVTEDALEILKRHVVILQRLEKCNLLIVELFFIHGVTTIV